MTNHSDQKFIAYALNLSKKNLGLTAPNPVVGCVIVKDDVIISSAVTAKGGRPHAEKIAIEKVTNKSELENAVIYVTLEPCAHFGQTPPCVDAILKYKFRKVVIATQDPDLRVDGAAIQKLSDAGIEVVCGIMEKEAQEINRGFFKARREKMPFVTLKLATSLDGKIATKDFDSQWITSEKSRFFSHYLRSTNDAILVGANTVRKDNPSLNCRIPGLEDYSPKRVIISSSQSFDLSLKIFQNLSEIPTIILTDCDNKKIANSAAEIIFCKEKNGKVNLHDALLKLCESGVNSVLIEGGKNISTQFLKESLVDEIVWIRNKKIIGNDGIAAIGDMGFSKISDVLDGFEKMESKEMDGDAVEIYRKK